MADEQRFEAITLSEEEVNALIVELQTGTPLSQFSHSDARKVFDRMAERGYVIAREV